MESAPAGRPDPAPRRARLHAAAPVIVLFAALALLVAACGGSSNNGASGSGSESGSGSSSPSPSATGAVAFAQCMRTNGVSDFPDPQGGHFLISNSVQSNPSFHSAVSKCQHMLGPNGATNGGGANTSKLLAFAHCMQTHGEPKFPDPTAGGAIGLPQGIDSNSTAFQKAWSECQSKLPGNLQGQQP
jgi:hypothetical protein